MASPWLLMSFSDEDLNDPEGEHRGELLLGHAGLHSIICHHNTVYIQQLQCTTASRSDSLNSQHHSLTKARFPFRTVSVSITLVRNGNFRIEQLYDSTSNQTGHFPFHQLCYIIHMDVLVHFYDVQSQQYFNLSSFSISC